MRLILPTIVISQLCCTSLWFAGNSIITDITGQLNLGPSFLAHLTSAIQFGFISGTLFFAVFTIADRFSPSLVFFLSSVLAGLFNFGISIHDIAPWEILSLRFLTGFFLAGIYPVGMKIASDYYRSGLGKSLGFLVGALVLGTAFPHLLKSMSSGPSWKYVIYITSVLSISGGLAVYRLVPDGPYRRAGQKINFKAFAKVFGNKSFRSVTFGYFGHMWELYTFWAFVPVILTTFSVNHTGTSLNVPLLSFFIIGSGGLACAFSGIISQYLGTKKTAAIALFSSGLCCLASPLLLGTESSLFLLIFLFIWGLVVIADSPLFSTLVALNSPEESRGTSLTIVNCIGFSITILSIQCISALYEIIDYRYVYLFLAPGPILGLLALLGHKGESTVSSEN